MRLEPMAIWLSFLLIAATLSFAAYEVLAIVDEQRRVRKLTVWTGVMGRREPSRLLATAERLLGWYGRNSLQYRLAQAGNPRFIGETPAHFYAAKLVLALVVGLRLGGSGLPLLAYGFVGFMAPDFLIWIGIRRRRELIQAELPKMLDFLRRTLAGGTSMKDALAALPDRLTGPLAKEVMRLSAHYALTLNLPECLDEFANRLGMEEVDHLCLALKQSEATGRVKSLLARQAELLKSRLKADKKKGDNNKQNFLPLISVLVVFNILILIAMPLYIQFTETLGGF